MSLFFYSITSWDFFIYLLVLSTDQWGENRARQLRNVSYPSCYAIVQEFIVHRSETFRKCHLVMVSWSNKKEKKKNFSPVMMWVREREQQEQQQVGRWSGGCRSAQCDLIIVVVVVGWLKIFCCFGTHSFGRGVHKPKNFFFSFCSIFIPLTIIIT